MTSPSSASERSAELAERTQLSELEGAHQQDLRPAICILAGFDGDESWYPLPLEADRADYTVGDLRSFIANRVLHVPPWAFRLFAGRWDNDRTPLGNCGDAPEDENAGLFSGEVDDVEPSFILEDEQEWEIVADRDASLLTKWLERIAKARRALVEKKGSHVVENLTPLNDELSQNDAPVSPLPELGLVVYFRYMKRLLPAEGDRWSMWEIIDDLKHSHETFCSARGVAPSAVSQEGFFGWFHHCGNPCHRHQDRDPEVNCFNSECTGDFRTFGSCDCRSKSGRGCCVAFNLVKEVATPAACDVVRLQRIRRTQKTGLHALQWRSIQDDWTAYACARNFSPSEENRKNKDVLREMLKDQKNTYYTHLKKIRSCFLSLPHLEDMQKICGAAKNTLTTDLPPALRDIVSIGVIPGEGTDAAESFAQSRANTSFFVVDRYIPRASGVSTSDSGSVTSFPKNTEAAHDPAFPYIRRVRAYEYIKLRIEPHLEKRRGRWPLETPVAPLECPCNCQVRRYFGLPWYVPGSVVDNTPVHVHCVENDSHLKSCASCRRGAWREYLSHQDSSGFDRVETMPPQRGYWRLRWTREYCESRLGLPATFHQPSGSSSPCLPRPRGSRCATKWELPVFFHRIRYAKPVRATCPMHEQPLSSSTAVEQRLATQWTRLRAHDAAMDAVEFFIKDGCPDQVEGDNAKLSSQLTTLHREADCIYRHAKALPSETRTKTFSSHERRHFVCQKSTKWIEPFLEECPQKGVRNLAWRRDADRYERSCTRSARYGLDSDQYPSEIEDSSDDDYLTPDPYDPVGGHTYTFYYEIPPIRTASSGVEVDELLLSYDMRKDRQIPPQRQENRLRRAGGKHPPKLGKRSTADEKQRRSPRWNARPTKCQRNRLVAQAELDVYQHLFKTWDMQNSLSQDIHPGDPEDEDSFN
ncbi:unnamed protein product [Amoebophrya sp. A25]|nr:unnamed protein product [Amoebophrya sp. A25]|eukprot:GSA25T00017629001.1